MQNGKSDLVPVIAFPLRLDTIDRRIAFDDAYFNRGSAPVPDLNILLSPPSNQSAQTTLFNQ